MDKTSQCHHNKQVQSNNKPRVVNVNITPDHNTNIQSPTEDNVFLQQHTTISPQLCERPTQKQQQPTKS